MESSDSQLLGKLCVLSNIRLFGAEHTLSAQANLTQRDVVSAEAADHVAALAGEWLWTVAGEAGACDEAEAAGQQGGQAQETEAGGGGPRHRQADEGDQDSWQARGLLIVFWQNWELCSDQGSDDDWHECENSQARDNSSHQSGPASAPQQAERVVTL